MALESPNARAKQLIRRLEARARQAGVATESRIEVGTFNEQLHEAVERTRPDLIVMGNEGRKGLDRWMLGSATEDAVRDDMVPVLAIPAEPHPTLAEPPQFRSVLVATDLSEDPRKTMEYLRALIGETVDVRMLHVVSKPSESKDSLERLLMEHMDAAYPDGLRSEVQSRRLAAQIEIGKPGDRILDVADRTAADVVVMNSHHDGTLRQAVFGTTVESVLRDARRPVLTIPGS
jgi:nucleotide-binding universal stress UspA family protein